MKRMITGAAVVAMVAAITAPAASAQEFTLRIHTLARDPHPFNDVAKRFAEYVEAESDGRIEVRIFDAGQLGQDPAVISEIGLGTIDMMVSTSSNAAQQIPELAIFTMPYLFADMDEIAEALGPGTEGLALFQQAFEDRGIGLRLLALGGSGTRNMATVATEVTGPGDLSGLRMRTPPSPMDSETWAAFGMLPTTIAWGELYAAMQSGLADAFESSLPAYLGSQLFEVAPNLVLTEHVVQVHHVSMSEVTWGRLPEDLQEIVVQGAIEGNIFGMEMSKQYDGELVDRLAAEHGVTVWRPDIDEFRAILEPVKAELAERLDLMAEFTLLTE